MEKLYTKEYLEKNLDDLHHWEKSAFLRFGSIVADEENTYPCILGRQGFLSDHMRFGFIGDPRNADSINDLAVILEEYGVISRDTGAYASLVAFFNTPQDIIETYSIKEYENLFWSVLNAVTQKDPKAWPEGISSDPAHHSWEFCFNQEPYFSFCSTPAHKERRSRYFPCFMITFQPRWVFEGINDSTVFGRKTKEQIRKRLKEYDHAPVHPDLKWYGQENNHEWKQYFLHDDSTSPSRCPFSKNH